MDETPINETNDEKNIMTTAEMRIYERLAVVEAKINALHGHVEWLLKQAGR